MRSISPLSLLSFATLLATSLASGCPGPEGTDAGPPDAGALDAGADAGAVAADAGEGDGGPLDAGAVDGGDVDAGVDGGNSDAGVDGGDADAGVDAGEGDGGPLDAGTVDAGAGDAGAPDGGTEDGGPVEPAPCEGSCPLDVIPRRATLPLGVNAAADGSMAMFAIEAGVTSSGGPGIWRGEATWRSLDNSVATIDVDGNVHPVAAGTTFIEAQINGKIAYSEITVAGALVRRTISVGGETRVYFLYTPPTLPSGEIPLVLSFHGGGGNGRLQMAMSQMNRPAAEAGFAVAYPTGSGLVNTWNAGGCCGEAEANGVDDVSFAIAVVNDVDTVLNLDRQRVYSTGFSNGGMLSHRLACEAAEVFAAVAPVGGQLYEAGDFPACTPTRAIPILMMHGTSDVNYPYLGGLATGISGETYPPVEHPTEPSTLSHWQTTNGSVGEPTVVYAQGIVQCRQWTGTAEVQMCKLDPPTPLLDDNRFYDGAGHAFPGGSMSESPSSDIPSQDIQAAEYIWEFFEAHSLP